VCRLTLDLQCGGGKGGKQQPRSGSVVGSFKEYCSVRRGTTSVIDADADADALKSYKTKDVGASNQSTHPPTHTCTTASLLQPSLR
jgi:hypothetical protein